MIAGIAGCFSWARVSASRAKYSIGLDPLLRVDEVIDHLLDRAGAVGEALIVRQVDHPHPAAAEQPFDLIAMLEDGAGGERSGQGPELSPFVCGLGVSAIFSQRI